MSPLPAADPSRRPRQQPTTPTPPPSRAGSSRTPCPLASQDAHRAWPSPPSPQQSIRSLPCHRSILALCNKERITQMRDIRSGHTLGELLRTPYLRSSHNLSSSHSGGASSTMSHPPKPRHIGQTVHTRESAYA